MIRPVFGRSRPSRYVLVGMFVVAIGLMQSLAQPPEAKKTPREPWTTSRVVGSPEPPHPYRAERVFPKLSFRNGVHIESCPVGERFFITEQAGKIMSFLPDPAVAKTDLFLDLREVKSCKPGKVVKDFGAAYGMTFHPQFAQIRYCYVCYMLRGHEKKGLSAIERVVRFTVRDADPPTCDPDSELVILEWRTEPGGHNGGCLRFGPDGFLYISMGDGAAPSPPDGYDTGQNLTDFLSTILRIDVDRQEDGKPYAVPKNNPFAARADAKPEIWAYGFRNPWKMSFDRATGDLWVGDVGWELWEMAYNVKKGGNYGWSVMEGPQAVRPHAKRGPTPILPPTIALPHSEAACIIGGHVYRGSKFKDLVGAYVYGDWMTLKLWATKFEGDKQVSHREIVQGRQKIICFAEDRHNELFWLDYDESGAGGIYTLAPNEAAAYDPAKFPRKLSETGLFKSVERHDPAAGVAPYTINAEPWMDHATAERLLALPGTEAVKVYDTPQKVPGTAWFTTRYFFPKDAVLVKTMGVETETGNPRSRRRVETQLLHFDGSDWHGYTYRWNAEQTDAVLVPAGGAEMELTVRDPDSPGGVRKQTWTFAGRGACLQCHNPWAWTVLGFTTEQLDRRGSSNPLAELTENGLVNRVDGKGKPLGDKPKSKVPFPSSSDANADLGQRARAYLHVNCSHCHQSGAGGTAQIDLRFDNSLADLKAVDRPPNQGAFGIADGRLVASGDPYHSVLYYRMAKTGSGRMPHIGSEVVDRPGVGLMHDWIAGLPTKEKPANEGAEAASLERLCAKNADAANRTRDVERVLATTSGALRLTRALDTNAVPAELREQVVNAAAASPEAPVRDLFERFLPAERRIKRLGTLIRPETILALKGDPARGRQLFFQTGTTQCANCHRIDGKGSTLGPDLTQIGKKFDRAKVLESILDPSKEIDKAFVAYTLATTDGRLLTGLLVKRDEKEVVLRDAQDKEQRIPAAQVEQLVPSPKSLMPEQLLRDLTAQQAADLVEFLAGLK